MAIITTEDALAYLQIDYADETTMRNVQLAVDAAVSTLLGSVGEDVETYLPGDARVKNLALLYMADSYSERLPGAVTSGQKAVSAQRWQVQTLEWQLRTELRRAREAAS